MTKPVRIQPQRTKGWRMPPNTVKVDRSTRWGNPCKIGQFEGYSADEAVRDFRLWIERDPTVRSFENAHGKPPSIAEIHQQLAGQNLACWCKPGAPCHADVLLEMANREDVPCRN